MFRTTSQRGSLVIAQRLQAAEFELARLQGAQQPAKRLALIVPDMRGRFVNMVGRLDQVLLQDPERGRDKLRGILGERIKLQPDVSGKFLWADYSLGISALLPIADLMVAGAGLWTYLLRLPRELLEHANRAHSMC